MEPLNGTILDHNMYRKFDDNNNQNSSDDLGRAPPHKYSSMSPGSRNTRDLSHASSQYSDQIYDPQDMSPQLGEGGYYGHHARYGNNMHMSQRPMPSRPGYSMGGGNLYHFFEHQCPELTDFLLTAPNYVPNDQRIVQLKLSPRESISCVRWNNRFYITGTDIVRILTYRFQLFGRDIENRKKFEEGIFSDLRNLKTGIAASLENPRSELLEFLYAQHCVRTKKKQKVFFWNAVNHDRMFLETLERELKKDSAYKMAMNLYLNRPNVGGVPPPVSSSATIPVREPALSFMYDSNLTLEEQLYGLIPDQRSMRDGPPALPSSGPPPSSMTTHGVTPIPRVGPRVTSLVNNHMPNHEMDYQLQSSPLRSPQFEDNDLLSGDPPGELFSRSMVEPYYSEPKDPNFPDPIDSRTQQGHMLRRSRSGPHIQLPFQEPPEPQYRRHDWGAARNYGPADASNNNSRFPDEQGRPPLMSSQSAMGISARPDQSASQNTSSYDRKPPYYSNPMDPSSSRYQQPRLMRPPSSHGAGFSQDNAGSMQYSDGYRNSMGHLEVPQYPDRPLPQQQQQQHSEDSYLDDFEFKMSGYDKTPDEEASDARYQDFQDSDKSQMISYPLMNPGVSNPQPRSSRGYMNFPIDNADRFYTDDYSRLPSPQGLFGPPENECDGMPKQSRIQAQVRDNDGQSLPNEDAGNANAAAFVGPEQRRNSACKPEFDTQDPK